MAEVPVTSAIAEYQSKRFTVVFSGEDWVALQVPSGYAVPDGFEWGESSVAQGVREPWVKVPRSALAGLIHVRVSGLLAGQPVSVQRQLPDGQVAIEFVGPPATARELGLDGDQYVGWTGLIDPEQLTDIEVEEIRRA